MGSMSGGQLTALPELPASWLLGGGSGAHSGPVSVVEGLPLCGNFEPARATIAKCALLAHLFIRTHSGEECH